jgi:peptide/nickel transport system ATP-binding protein
MSAVSVKNLRVALEPSGVDVVDDVSFSIEAGEVVGLVGESGSGKTTVAVALLGDARRGARITNGTITVDGEDILGFSPQRLRALRGCGVAYVPQDPVAALNPSLRIGTQLRELFEFHDPELPSDAVADRIKDALTEVHLPADDALLRKFPHQLSGGQQQRVTIAMAFVLRPKLIVLDEPTTGLDAESEVQVMAGLQRLIEGRTTILITHSTALARSADHVAVIAAGRVVEYDTPQRLLTRDSAFRRLTSTQHRHDDEHPDPAAVLDALIQGDRQVERT